ncbi:MAG: DNA-3-methyladenine glycosylase [Spirochaetaceae bacterium]|jgi:DNA-3-methyladenine glycosylase|nr:DNA-3-methyladenine glycosylase [Spirochaetaceae bacterium]
MCINASRLKASYYRKNALLLAPALLGKLLCRELRGKIIRLRITETEAYYGEDDTACHASRGKTERTKIMYGCGGYAYVYLCYGVHWLLNVVSGRAGFPEAVLIRGVEGFPGPGKLSKHLEIDKTLHGENLALSGRLWLEGDGRRRRYRASTRVGINGAAAEDRNKLWRFVAE